MKRSGWSDATREAVVTPRPSLTPILWFSASSWGGVWIGASAAFNGTRVATAVVAIAVGVLIATGVRSARAAGSLFTVVVLAVACGTATGAMWGIRVARSGESVAGAGFREWAGAVASDPRDTGSGLLVQVRLDRRSGGGLVDLWWSEGAAEPSMGQRVVFRAALKPSTDSAERRFAYMKGVCASGRALGGVVTGWPGTPVGWTFRLRAQLREGIGELRGTGGALLGAIVVGYREPLRGSPAESDFRATGTSHLLAVSGTHIAIVAGFIGSVARALRARRGPATIIVVGCAVIQCVLCGLQSSAVRACGMAAVAGTAGLGGRRADTLASLGACVSAIVLMSPVQAFSLGLRLSACAVLGIAVFGRLAEGWVRAALPRCCRRLAGPLAIAIVAQCATLPVSVPIWQSVSLISPFANIVAVPLASCALVLGVIGAVVSPLSATGAHVVWRFAGGVLATMAAILSRLAALPSATVLVGVGAATAAAVSVVAAFALWAWWPSRPNTGLARVLGGTVLLAGLLVVAGAYAPHPAEIVFLDVGQGDAVLVRDGSQAMLVDCGPDDATLRAALSRFGVRRLDGVVFTHDHADHTGGAGGLRGAVSVSTLFIGGTCSQSDASVPFPGADVRRLSAGDSFRIGDLDVTVLWPERTPNEPAVETDENSRSIVLLVRGSGVSVLLTGDAEEPVWQTLAHGGGLPDCDVLKVPHHGSEAAVSPDSLAAISPQLAIVSVGTGNDFGHPSASTLSELADAGSRILRTDTAGDIRVRLKHGAFSVRWSRHGESTVACETIHGVHARLATLPNRRRRTASSWQRATFLTSSPSISSTAPKSTYSTRRSIDSRPGSPRSPTLTTT